MGPEVVSSWTQQEDGKHAGAGDGGGDGDGGVMKGDYQVSAGLFASPVQPKRRSFAGNACAGGDERL